MIFVKKSITIKKCLSFFIAIAIACGCFSFAQKLEVDAESYNVEFLGASINFETPKNLRFKFCISDSEIENAKEYGALITTPYILGDAELVLGADSYVYTKAVAYDKANNIDEVLLKTEDSVHYAVSLNGISEDDYDKLFIVRPYIIYNDDTVVYGKTVTKSVYDVALCAAEDTTADFTDTERGEFYKIKEDHILDGNNYPVNLNNGNSKVEEIQKITNQKVDEIRSSASKYTGTTIYYVASDGNDNFSGTSEKGAWKTLNKVNSASLKSGDVVLFKRGDVFRGQLTMKNGVTYSAYGVGDKPCIFGSPTNGADADMWTKYPQSENIWVYRDTLFDVGTIVLNDGEDFAIKIAPYFNDKFTDADGNDFDIIAELDKNYEFFSDCKNVLDSNGYPDPAKSTGTLYLYCDKGNPGEVFDSIEFCAYGNIITGANTKNVTIDNLCIKYGGSHGIGTSNVVNFVVRNCEIGWIGGSILKYNTINGKPSRYGNGVQVHTASNGFEATDNYIYQIFDAGLTHQQSNLPETSCEFKNIVYKNNVIEKCAWSVEYYMNTPSAGYVHKMSNIEISDNIMRLAGGGFGNLRNDEWHYPCHIMSWWSSTNTNNAAGDTVIISNNIFDRSVKSLIEIHAEVENSLPVLSGNTYIQNVDGYFGRYSLEESSYYVNQNLCNNLMTMALKNIDNSKNAKLYFTDYSAEISDKVLSQASYFSENPITETHAFTVNLANRKAVRYLKVLKNGTRLTETKIGSLKNTAVGEPIKIAFFSDTHFVAPLTENDSKKQNLVDLYELRKNTFRNTVKSTPASLAFGNLFDKTVIGGDLFDFYSEGNMNLFKQTVTDIYPDVLTVLGNHEAAEGFSGITPDIPTPLADIYAELNAKVFGYNTIKDQGSFKTLEEAEIYNDIYLAHNLVKDSKGNEKALLLMMDNQNYTYQFSNLHYERLEFYIEYAHTNKIPILIFQHSPICTGRNTEIVSPYDIITNGNGVGENWGMSSSIALPGHGYHDTRNPMTNKVYDLIVNNADVVKGIFCGHVHNNVYTEIVAKTSAGADTIIPQYTIAGNYFYSNINLITVE